MFAQGPRAAKDWFGTPVQLRVEALITPLRRLLMGPWARSDFRVCQVGQAVCQLLW